MVRIFVAISGLGGDRQIPYHQIINEDLMIFARENLGFGAFGVVFKGSYRSKPCAVKVLHRLVTLMQTNLIPSQKNEDSRVFDRECELLKSFQHPNIVQYLSTCKHPMSNSEVLVMELMDCSLRSYLSGLGEEGLTSHCQLSLIKDVASGVA